MKKLILFSILCCASLGFAKPEKRKPSSIDLRSSQEIAFYDKKDTPFSDMGKPASFQGYLVFVNEPRGHLSEAHLYRFTTTPSSMTESECTKYVNMMFGSPSDRAMQFEKTPQLFETTTGKVCEFRLKDTYVHSHIPFRYGLIGVIHGKTTALSWDFYEKVRPQEADKLRDYFKSLK